MAIWLIIVSVYLFCGGLFSSFFGAYVLSKGNTLITKLLSALCIFVSFYLFGYLLELNSTTMSQMLMWNQIQYIGIPFYPVLWLLLSLAYNKIITSINPKLLAALLFIPLLTFFMRITNFIHHLYYSEIMVKTYFGSSFLILHKDLFYYINCGYTVLCFILSTIFYIKNTHQSLNSRRTESLIFLASLLPYVGLALIIRFQSNSGFDYAALLIPVSILLLAFSSIKYDFFQLETLARENLFDESADAMILINNLNIIMDYNPVAQIIFNSLSPSAIGKDISVILKSETAFLEALKSHARKDLTFSYENNHKYFELKTVAIENAEDRIVGKLITLIDITERKRIQESLNFLATTDSMTGLYNRSHFMNLANTKVETCGDEDCFSLLMMDIDKFKKINDTWGHAAGDAVLRHVGKMMNEHFSNLDSVIIGRLGGEEFAVLLPNVSIDYAENIAEDFRIKVSKNFVQYEDMKISFTISIGLTSYSDEFKSFDDMLKLADKAMYESKSAGRNMLTIIKI